MLNEHDIRHATETWIGLMDTDEEYDGPTIIMTSIGYVEVSIDGDVIAHGVIIANVAG